MLLPSSLRELLLLLLRRHRRPSLIHAKTIVSVAELEASSARMKELGVERDQVEDAADARCIKRLARAKSGSGCVNSTTTIKKQPEKKENGRFVIH
jgi:hypothetical protein